MKRLAALLICLISLVPVVAQDAPPVITPENAAALTLLESIGSDLPTGVQFSPDGRYILAVTTDRTLVYSAENPNAEPQIFPYNEFTFDDDGYLVIGGERRNLDTGLSFGVLPSINIVRENRGDPAVIEVVKPGGGTMRVQTVVTENISRMAVNDAFTVLAVATEGDFQTRTAPTVHLYRTVSGQQIAAIPHGRSGFPILRLHFTNWGDSELLLVESMAATHMTQGEVALIRLPRGIAEPEYSGTIWDGVRYSPDGKFAYRLEDKIVYGSGVRIGSVPYADDGIFGTPDFFAVTDSGIAAVLNEDTLQFAAFTDEGELSDFVTVPLDPQVSRRWGTAGDHVVMNVRGTLHVWDMLSDSTEPRIIEPDPSIPDDAIIQLSPDLARYRYFSGGRAYVHDAETHAPVADMPDRAAFSPDWSRAAYFDGKLLTVRDLAAEQEYTREVIPGYLGDVEDIQNGYAAFTGGALQVVDLDPADGHADTVTIDGLFDGAHFFDGGACIVTFAPAEDAMSHTVIHRLNASADCDPQTYLTPATGLTASVTTDGRYLADMDLYCNDGWGYGVPTTNIYPLAGQPSGELPVILSIPFACGRQTFAFTGDNESIYFVGDTLRYMTLGATGYVPVDVESADVRLSYEDRPNHTFARVAGVVLSPDEEKIAVYLEDSKGADYVQERYIEVFALDDLESGTLRRDVRPLQTIPDATVATFSPDSRYVVTDQGLYAVEFFNQTPAVNGTISAFSPDSQLLATYQDGFVTLWRVPQPSANNFPLAQYDIRGVRELAFSDDGTRLYVIRAGEVQVWGIAP
jgi:WD40 repeat protein